MDISSEKTFKLPADHAMELKRKTIRQWCIAGFFSIVTVAIFWHYLYNWTGHSTIIGFIAPVNESVWEHLKLGYWGILIFSAVEFTFVRNTIHNLFLAKASGVVVLSLTILAIFYSYTSITGYFILWIDISSFVAGAFLCQWLIFKLYFTRSIGQLTEIAGIVFLLITGLLFAVFTSYPPDMPIFIDNSLNSH